MAFKLWQNVGNASFLPGDIIQWEHSQTIFIMIAEGNLGWRNYRKEENPWVVWRIQSDGYQHRDCYPMRTRPLDKITFLFDAERDIKNQGKRGNKKQQSTKKERIEQ